MYTKKGKNKGTEEKERSINMQNCIINAEEIMWAQLKCCGRL